MIDKILMSKTGIEKGEINTIVQNTKLQTNSKAGILYYDNEKAKNLDGFYIRIETNKTGRLKFECSLNKYYNYVRSGHQTNFDIFSFANAKTAIELLTSRTEIDLESLKVNYYEIGLSLPMKKDCRQYIDKMQTVGNFEERQKLFVNPRYKKERLKTTVFHRDIKKVYKVYDKIFEMTDKKRKDLPPELPNILRIETTYRRVEGLTVKKLFQPATIKRLTDQFLKDWRTVQFDYDIEVPKGTHHSKKLISIAILNNGIDYVIEQVKKNGVGYGMRKRGIKEFVLNDWEGFKDKISLIKTDEEREFRTAVQEAVNIAKQ
jgi:hypothetical protein